MLIIGCDFHTRYRQIAMANDARAPRPRFLRAGIFLPFRPLPRSNHYTIPFIF